MSQHGDTNDKNDLMNVRTPKMEAMGFIAACHKSVFFCYNRMCEAKKRFVSPGSGGLAVLGHSDIWQSGEGLLLHQPLTQEVEDRIRQEGGQADDVIFLA